MLSMLFKLVVVVAIGFQDSTFDEVKTDLSKNLLEYEDCAPVQRSWDEIQQKYNCCGVVSFSDWYILKPERTLPNSCCPQLNELGECTVETRREVNNKKMHFQSFQIIFLCCCCCCRIPAIRKSKGNIGIKIRYYSFYI